VTVGPATSDPEPETAVLDGRPLSFVVEGPRDAPALVLVPGIPGTVRDFRYLAPLLTDAVRVVRVDLPGFGGSAPSRDAVATMRGRARAVLRLADHLGLRRFGVLGHSMGGGTAVALASRHRERVDLLALVCSVALRRHRGLGMPASAFRRGALGLRVPLVRRWLLPRVREAYRRRGFPGAETLTAPELAVQLRAIGAVDFREMRAWLAGPLPPTLVAYSRDDHMVETDISEELARALPRARVLAFAEGGHNLQKTRAAELAAALKDCLRAGTAAAEEGRARP
jgi:pimeloyl-ACP methyl ester carboxylesterase